MFETLEKDRAMASLGLRRSLSQPMLMAAASPSS